MPRPRNSYLLDTVIGEAQISIGHLVCTEEQTQNTDAGTFTSGAWRIRNLNTERVNTCRAQTGLLPQITLRSGIYEVRASAPGFGVDAHQTRLYDVTNAAVLLVGTVEQCSGATDDIQTRSVIAGRIYLTTDTAIRLEHRCETTNVGNGMGQAANFTTEVYAILEIHKVSE